MAKAFPLPTVQPVEKAERALRAVVHAPDVRVLVQANGTAYVPSCTCGTGCIVTFGSHTDEATALEEAADLLHEREHGPLDEDDAVDPLLSDPVSARIAAQANLNTATTKYDEPIDYWPVTVAEQHRSAFALKMELNS